MKVVVDIPETPKNDKQRWALTNGTPYEERPHGEWVLDKEFSFVFNIYECSKCRFDGSKRWKFCPNCGADMRVKDELNRVNKELNSEIEKSKSVILPDYRDGWRLKGGDEK